MSNEPIPANRTDLEQVKFAPHPPIASHDVAFKYYHSAQSYMRFINKDGTVMEFKHHFLATNNSAHQDYLDEEILKHRNNQLSYASEEEIESYKFKIDPKGTVTQQIIDDPDAMAELKWRIENNVRKNNGLDLLPAPEGSGWDTPENDGDNDLAKIQGVDPSKGNQTVATPTGKITLDSLKPKGPEPIVPSSTKSLPQ